MKQQTATLSNGLPPHLKKTTPINNLDKVQICKLPPKLPIHLQKSMQMQSFNDPTDWNHNNESSVALQYTTSIQNGSTLTPYTKPAHDLAKYNISVTNHGNETTNETIGDTYSVRTELGRCSFGRADEMNATMPGGCSPNAPRIRTLLALTAHLPRTQNMVQCGHGAKWSSISSMWPWGPLIHACCVGQTLII